MGFLGSGWTTTASSQKSSGRSASSGGEVLSIVRSVARRRRLRSARPRTGRSLLLEGPEVRRALTSVAHAGRDDATNDHASLGPIRVDHGERKPLGQPDRDDALFPVVPACVVALQGRSVGDERGELDIESALPKVSGTLPRVPREAHPSSIRVYIRKCNEPSALPSSLTDRH